MKKGILIKPLVLVIWKDACSLDDWGSVNEPLLPAQCVSSGFLIEITDTHITLALNHDLENENMSCVMTIPSGMVEKVINLKPKGQRSVATIENCLRNRKKRNRR